MTEEERAATKVQALVRGRSGRAEYALVRDEEACRQWIEYYVALGEYEDAEELGWDGEDPPPPTEEELEANIAAVQMEESLQAAAPSEIQQVINSRAEPEPAAAQTRTSITSSDVPKLNLENTDSDSASSPRWLQDIAQKTAKSVGGLAQSVGGNVSGRSDGEIEIPSADATAKQICAAIVVQTWARVVLARARVRDERHARHVAELQLAQLEKKARLIQGTWLDKKASESMARDQGAAIIVQSWARVLLAKITVYQQARQLRLLAFFTHMEDRKAAAIQQAYRASRAIRMAGLAAACGTEEHSSIEARPPLTPKNVYGAAEVGEPVEAHTSKPRFGKPTGQLTPELDSMVTEIALRRGATLIRRVSRQAMRYDLHHSLKGVLWKRHHNMPRFQRRAVYVTPLYADGPPALCYVGPPPHNLEKQIPLASISSVMFESERRLEFSIDATSRKHKLVFRADDEKECFQWIDGISLLLSLSDYADYVPL